MRYFIFLLSVFLFSCSGTDDADGNKVDSPNVVNLKMDSTSDWRSLTESWTASLNLKNASIMKSFYADTVSYYGDRISSADVVMRQSSYFAKNADYKQKITEFISEELQPDGTWRVRLMKQVTAGGKTADYPSSLVFGRSNGIWKIVNESDDISDLTKARVQEVHFAPEVVTIEGLLEETTGFGKTNGGDPKSDARENYNIVWPSTLIDVLANGGSRDGVNVKGVDKIQVVGNDNAVAGLLNKKVKITGTIRLGTGEHEFTKVVLDVKSIEEVK
ncbi:MAG TPA: DUF4431 domain-containing protein [Bacteroidia bacterium]|jgi:hypothetical protein|nr:DUF4431 domain-containing protein [Bacteroidia bacterium]